MRKGENRTPGKSEPPKSEVGSYNHPSEKIPPEREFHVTGGMAKVRKEEFLDRIYRILRISHGALRERREKEVEVESLKKPAKRVT